MAYDVADPQRLVRTFKTMLGYGDRVQYSVFLCDLSRTEMIQLKTDLAEVLDYGEDRVLIVDVGPSAGGPDGGGAGDARVETIGMQLPTGGRSPSFIV